MSDRKQRIGAIVGKDISDIVFGMKNEITTLASVNEVEMNEDNSIAKVYVSHLQEEKTVTLVNYLNGHKGQIRARLAHSLDIYKVPNLVFVKDDLYERGAKIDKIIASFHRK